MKKIRLTLKSLKTAGHLWLRPVIQGTQEAEIRRNTVGSQARQIIHKTLFRKKSITKERNSEMVQSIDPEFKPQTPQKKSLKRSYKMPMKNFTSKQDAS
jgi:hypothetical protein